MKPTLLITLTCLLLSNPGFTQRNSVQQLPTKASSRLLIRITPTGLLGRYSHHLPIGVEFGFLNNFGLQLDAGIPMTNALPLKWKTNASNEFSLRTEIRTYLSGRRPYLGFFMGLEGFVRQQNYTETGGHARERNGYDETSYESAAIQKHVYGGALKAGIRGQLKGRLFAECFVGAGVKNVLLNRDNIVGQKPPQKVTSFMISVNNEDNMPSGYANIIYFPVGISLSFLLGSSAHYKTIPGFFD